jgi:hypothetical protein
VLIQNLQLRMVKPMSTPHLKVSQIFRQVIGHVVLQDDVRAGGDEDMHPLNLLALM